jgi:hypothetical protein
MRLMIPKSSISDSICAPRAGTGAPAARTGGPLRNKIAAGGIAIR